MSAQIMECCDKYHLAKHNISNFAADTGSARGNIVQFDALKTEGLSQIPGSRAIPETFVPLYIHPV